MMTGNQTVDFFAPSLVYYRISDAISSLFSILQANNMQIKLFPCMYAYGLVGTSHKDLTFYVRDNSLSAMHDNNLG